MYAIAFSLVVVLISLLGIVVVLYYKLKYTKNNSDEMRASCQHRNRLSGVEVIKISGEASQKLYELEEKKQKQDSEHI